MHKLLYESERFAYIFINGEKTHFIVSDNGRIFSLEYAKDPNKIQQILYELNNDGHLVVTLKHKGKSYNRRVHRLVAEAFIPNPDNKPCIHHIDGDHLNNHYTNLIWVTEKEHSELTTEMHQHSHNYKFTEDQIKTVCELIVSEKYSIGDISKITSIPVAVIKKMIYTDYRDDITSKYDLSSYKHAYEDYTNFVNAKYTKSQIIDVCKLLEENKYSYKEISELTNVSVSVVKSIFLRKRWISISADYNF